MLCGVDVDSDIYERGGGENRGRVDIQVAALICSIRTKLGVISLNYE